MVRARDLTFEAVRRIAAEIRPGVTEGRGGEIAQEVLEAMGMDRLWHKNVVRFGPGTIETFHADFQPDYVLQSDDIFYVDLGAVWNGHEGDAGDTFVVGEDAEMHACAQAARTLWTEVAARWRDDGVTGEALYRFAKARAEAMGWTLNWEVKGHRVSDFPTRFTRPARSATSRVFPPRASGSSRSRSPTRLDLSAPSTRICWSRRRMPPDGSQAPGRQPSTVSAFDVLSGRRRRPACLPASTPRRQGPWGRW